LHAKVDKPPPESQEQESYEVVPKKKFGKALPDEDNLEEEAWGDAAIVPVQAKVEGKREGKDIPEQEENRGWDVPLSKMGPPIGVKKNSITTTKSKTKSTSSSRSHSRSEILPPLTITMDPKKPKPSPNRFRASPVSMDLGYPEFPVEHQHDNSLFLPGADDGYGEPELPKQPVKDTVSADDIIGGDDVSEPTFQHQPQTPSFEELPAVIGPSASLPQPGSAGGLDLSPEVPETQSQESSGAPSGVEVPVQDTASLEPESQRFSQADVAASSPGTSRMSSSPTGSSRSKAKSKSKPGDPKQPVASTSTSVPVSATEPSKPLHPLPQIPPSIFHPHLPVPQPTNIPSPDLEVTMESPPSSIDYFSSPEKPRTRDNRQLDHWDNSGVDGNSLRDTIISSDGSLRPGEHELVHNEPDNRRTEKEISEGDKVNSALSDIINNTSCPEAEFESDRIDESIIAQEMEDAYVDLSGGNGGEEELEVHAMPLAQEEEESTQDLQLEREEWEKLQAAKDGVEGRAVNGWGADQEMDVRVLLYYMARAIVASWAISTSSLFVYEF
jgi:hypothetical protein